MSLINKLTAPTNILFCTFLSLFLQIKQAIGLGYSVMYLTHNCVESYILCTILLIIVSALKVFKKLFSLQRQEQQKSKTNSYRG